MSDWQDYQNMRRCVYGDAYFVPVCGKCKRFVKPDSTVLVNDISGLSPEPNCYCSKCGRSHMVFEGFQ